MVAIGYEYPFSKRTLAYIGIGYKDVDKQLSNYSTKDKTTQTMLGLLHRF